MAQGECGTALDRPEQGAKALRPIRFSREMGMTHAEFFRSLPAALAGRLYTLHHGKALITEDDRCISIKLCQESERTLGSLRLPMTHVSFTFVGYATQEVERFMAQFNLHFQRGGG